MRISVARVTAALVPLVAPAALVAVHAPTAYAARPTATVSAPPGVLYNACVDHLVDYTVTLDTPDTTWQLNVETADPQGTDGGSNYRGNTYGHPASGTVPVSMCGQVLDPGIFTLTGVLIHGVTNVDQVAPSTFTLRNPLTNTAIKPRTTDPRKGQRVKIKIKSRDEMPGAYTPKDDGRVFLQQKKAAGWRKVRGSASSTDEDGKAVVRFRYRGGTVKLRAVTKGSVDWDASRSPKVKLR